MNVLVVVPARGGSVGVHRKNLRLVKGEALVDRAIRIAVDQCAYAAVVAHDEYDVQLRCRVVLSSDDDEILRRGDPWVDQVVEHPSTQGKAVWFHAMRRHATRAAADAPVTAAVDDVLEKLRLVGEPDPDIVAIIQPASLGHDHWVSEMLLEMVYDQSIDSMATMHPWHGFLWTQDGEPQILNRVNRQEQTERLVETGFVQMCRDYPRSDGWYGDAAPQIGPNHRPYLVPQQCSIDIDTQEDLVLARIIEERGFVLFITTGNEQIGSGHLHRVAAVASEVGLLHDVAVAAVDTPADFRRLIPDRILDDGLQTINDVVLFCHRERPSLIVLDVLDDPRWETDLLHEWGYRTIRLECDDLTCGALLHVSALRSPLSLQSFAGPEYFDLRDEFWAPYLRHKGGPVLVSFGGTDPAGHSVPVCNRIADMGYPVRLIPPPLSSSFDAGDLHGSVEIVEQPSIPREMSEASILVTSRGRTAWEAAFMGLPMVCLPANERERDFNQIPEHAVSADTIDDVAITVSALSLLEDSWDERSLRLREEVDGYGVDRLAKLISIQATERVRHSMTWERGHTDDIA